jgi:ribosomal protein S18 acetylase RimI-like enzyme
MTGISSEHNASTSAARRDPPGTQIRPAHYADAPAVGALLASALAPKYRPTLGRRAAEALTRVIGHELRASAHGYWVAERDAQVIGAAHLATVEDPPAVGVARRLAQVVGWTRTLWALGALSILSHGPLAEDEAYIGELAVASAARRQGVALMLMRHLDAQAAALGKSRVTLWVTDDNDAARALYVGLGFTEHSDRRWRLGRLIFKSRRAILMEKRLAGTVAP